MRDWEAGSQSVSVAATDVIEQQERLENVLSSVELLI